MMKVKWSGTSRSALTSPHFKSTIPLPPITQPRATCFRTAPVLPATTTLVGDYSLGDATAHVGLAGDALQLSIPGQPSYDLVPTRGLSFNLKGLSGFSVEFKKDPSGKISEMLVAQPGGRHRRQEKILVTLPAAIHLAWG